MLTPNDYQKYMTRKEKKQNSRRNLTKHVSKRLILLELRHICFLSHFRGAVTHSSDVKRSSSIIAPSLFVIVSAYRLEEPFRWSGWYITFSEISCYPKYQDTDYRVFFWCREISHTGQKINFLWSFFTISHTDIGVEYDGVSTSSNIFLLRIIVIGELGARFEKRVVDFLASCAEQSLFFPAVYFRPFLMEFRIL